MKISSAGLKLIKEFEGCLQPVGDGMYKPYVCPAGVWTLGWGHTNHHGRPFNADTRWTKATCDAVLAEDLAGFEGAVRRLVKAPLNQHQFDALVSFAYNCGEGNLGKSTLLRKLNKKDYEGAAEQFAVWNKAKVNGVLTELRGLTRRRAAEAKLFRTPVGFVPPAPLPPDVPREPMPQQVDPPTQEKPAVQSTEIWSQLLAIITTVASVVTDVRFLALIVILFCAYQIWKRYERGDLKGLFK